jgi:hypothetical protein
MSDQERWRYRIAIVNDHRDTYAFMDFKKFGPVVIFEGCRVKGEDKDPNGVIGVFYNYNSVLRTDSYKQAFEEVERLISLAPDPARKEFELYKRIYFKK